jgi:hypothetical protein
MPSNARARSAPTDKQAGPFDYGTPDGYDFFLRLGAAANASKFFADEVVWTNNRICLKLSRVRYPDELTGLDART